MSTHACRLEPGVSAAVVGTLPDVDQVGGGRRRLAAVGRFQPTPPAHPHLHGAVIPPLQVVSCRSGYATDQSGYATDQLGYTPHQSGEAVVVEEPTGRCYRERGNISNIGGTFSEFNLI